MAAEIRLKPNPSNISQADLYNDITAEAVFSAVRLRIPIYTFALRISRTRIPWQR